MRLSYKKVRFVSNAMCVGTATLLVSAALIAGINNANTSVSIERNKQAVVSFTEPLLQINTAMPTQTPCVLENNKCTTECTYEAPVYEAPVYDIPLDAGLQKYTFDTCVKYGIEKHYELVLAIMWRESNFDTNAVSSTNDYGIMQINACNHKALKKKLKFVDIMEPENNIEAGIYLISRMLKKYDRHEALMAYNMGEAGARRQWRRGNYTSRYSRDIIDKANKILDKAAK